MSLEYGASSVFKLRYHLVIVTKYRKAILTDDIFSQLKKRIIENAENHHVTIELIENDITRRDHIYIIFRARPITNLAGFVQGTKTTTSKYFFKHFPEKKKELWNDKLWSKSYFLASVGNVERNIIENYVANQGAPNRVRNSNGCFIGSDKKY